MRSASDFLPSLITLLMTCWTSRFDGGRPARPDESVRRIGAAFLGSLDPVERAGLLAVRDPGRVERAANDLVADAWQILDPAAADEHNRVLLQVVALPGDVGGDLHPVGEAHTGDLAQGRVRLLRRYRGDTGADAAPLRRGDALLAPLPRLEARRRRLLLRALAALANKLVRVRHGRA